MPFTADIRTYAMSMQHICIDVCYQKGRVV